MYAVKALITWHCFFFIVLESIGIDETYDTYRQLRDFRKGEVC